MALHKKDRETKLFLYVFNKKKNFPCCHFMKHYLVNLQKMFSIWVCI